MQITRVSPKHQITISTEAFEKLQLEVGGVSKLKLSRRGFLSYLRNLSPGIKPGSGPRNGRKKRGRPMKLLPGVRYQNPLIPQIGWYGISGNVDEDPND